MTPIPLQTPNSDYVIEKGWRIYQSYSPFNEERLCSGDIFKTEQNARDYIFDQLQKAAEKAK